MKRNKQKKVTAVTLTAIIAVIAIGFLLLACDNNGGTEEQPKDQSAVLENLFSEGYTATVTGHLTDTEWTGVPDKIETALNAAFAAGNGPVKSRYRDVWYFHDVVIIVEKTVEYGKYKVADGEYGTLYLNLDALDELQDFITTAVTAMRDEEPKME